MGLACPLYIPRLPLSIPPDSGEPNRNGRFSGVESSAETGYDKQKKTSIYGKELTPMKKTILVRGLLLALCLLLTCAAVFAEEETEVKNSFEWNGY